MCLLLQILNNNASLFFTTLLLFPACGWTGPEGLWWLPGLAVGGHTSSSRLAQAYSHRISGGWGVRVASPLVLLSASVSLKASEAHQKTSDLHLHY